jgi:hypothetical protein
MDVQFICSLLRANTSSLDTLLQALGQCDFIGSDMQWVLLAHASVLL